MADELGCSCECCDLGVCKGCNDDDDDDTLCGPDCDACALADCD